MLTPVTAFFLYPKLSQMMSLESVLVGDKDYKSDNEKNLWRQKKVSLADLCSPPLISA